MTKPYIPKRGDILYMDFSPQAGREQHGWRPAVVVSPTHYNALSNIVLACPITSNSGYWQWKIQIPSGEPVAGSILIDQLCAKDYHARGAKYHGQFSDAFMQDVIYAISTLTT